MYIKINDKDKERVKSILEAMDVKHILFKDCLHQAVKEIGSEEIFCAKFDSNNELLKSLTNDETKNALQITANTMAAQLSSILKRSVLSNIEQNAIENRE